MLLHMSNTSSVCRKASSIMHRMYRWPFVRHIENSVHARCWGLQQASQRRAAGLDATGLGATGLGGTHACGAGQADNLSMRVALKIMSMLTSMGLGWQAVGSRQNGDTQHNVKAALALALNPCFLTAGLFACSCTRDCKRSLRASQCSCTMSLAAALGTASLSSLAKIPHRFAFPSAMHITQDPDDVENTCFTAEFGRLLKDCSLTE